MQIGEGSGWRLVVDAGRHPYGALIGAEHWAVELRQPELEALIRGVRALLEQHESLRPTLLAEEQISLELDLELNDTPAGAAPDPSAGTLHVALEGTGDHWALRFVLTPADGARGVEGGWSAEASPALVAALTGLAGRGA